MRIEDFVEKWDSHIPADLKEAFQDDLIELSMCVIESCFKEVEQKIIGNTEMTDKTFKAVREVMDAR